jgi:hypothetical protein
MVHPSNRLMLNTVVQKALMTPKEASSDLALQLVVAITMQRDIGESNNQPHIYPEFVSCNLKDIILEFALDHSRVLKLAQYEAFCLLKLYMVAC